MTGFDETLKRLKETVNDELEKITGDPSEQGDIVRQAAYYSLSAGGKRIRPIICLSFSEMFGTDISKVIDLACALEMIHTFSLIHDDLPGMDNDDLRRGNPTCHIVYGEGMAILAGDLLLNAAYTNVLSRSLNSEDITRRTRALLAISNATGINGMIGGQAIDLLSENKSINMDMLVKMHTLKTGALIKVPATVAAIMAGVDDAAQKAAEDHAEKLGLAFQIKDDILDVLSDPRTLGKTPGKDAKSNKATYVTMLGLEGAQSLLEKTTEEALESLSKLEEAGHDTSFMEQLTLYLLNRKK